MKKFLLAMLGVTLIGSYSLPVLAADLGDTEVPGDVENLEATPYDGAIKLTWDRTTDDTGVGGYKISYGTQSVDGTTVTDYDSEEDVGNVDNYVLFDLTNDTKYYFSIYAYDMAGNESEFWATEVSATPSASAGEYVDTDAPQVAKAEATDIKHVKVTFSEEIELPEEDAINEFVIENDDTFETLEVTEAVMDEEDTKNKTVILTTADQEADASYTLTAGTGVADLAGNIIISGTSDTAVFVGSDKAVEEVAAFALVKVEVVDATHLLVTFNKSVVLDSTDPTSNFTVAEKADETVELAITAVELGDGSDQLANSTALLTTDEQTADAVYVLTVVDVVDADDATLAAGEDTLEFTAGADTGDNHGSDGVKDAADFLAKYVKDAEKYVVTLTWSVPADNADLTVEQLLYMSADKGAEYDKEATLEPDVETYEVKDLAAGEYWFKLTQKDKDGNETVGSVVKVVLTETGPGVLGLALVSLGLGKLASRKKAKK